MKKITLSLLLTLSIGVSAQLKINEIMSNNVSAVMDDAYNYSMWVELYNSSTSLMYNQALYYFTDDLAKPKKWRPVSKNIVAGGFSLLYFEREDRTGHASFKLEPEGGKLYLLNSVAVVIDSVVYPPQIRNVSYGRKTNGSQEWVFFEQFSPGTSNNNKAYSSQRCGNPVFTLPAGFYTSTQNIQFANPQAGDTIYYTRNGSEPTRSSTRYVPGTSIPITATTVFRAKCFSAGKLSSNVITATYFLNERKIKLPIVSIVTDNANLNDNTIGIYVTGTNGIPGNGSNTPTNINQDWDRPVNLELFDTTRIARVNQEVDVTISGGWSRMYGQKSLRVSPRKKFGDNRLRYDFFKATKPDHKYKSILLRNSGNDFTYSMMRDAFMQSIVMKRLDLDYQAYEPAVSYMNGVYFGIQNLRETSGKDLIYSNYGLDDNDITLLESAEIATDTSFLPLSNYISQNDITQPAVYNKVREMMDVDNFINYMICEIYYGNTDWPDNNIKIWKSKINGKWRWIMYDTDFGYGLYDTWLYNHNTLSMALNEKTDDVLPAWSTLLLKRLVLNETFRNKFIDRFSVQISTTFDPARVNPIMDSLSTKIASEIVYHKAKWGSSRGFADDLTNMRNFTANRPSIMLGFLGSRFLNAATTQTIQLTSNVAGASYTFNNEPVIGSSVTLKSFKNRSIAIEAKSVPGNKFKQWEKTVSGNTTTLLSMGSNWKYFDGNAIPATNWYSAAYSDAAWKSGPAQLGYGSKGEKTVVGYGGNDANKYPTAYFRKTVTITDLAGKSNFSLKMLVDDGAAVYVNGQEIGRYVLPTGTLAFNTLATAYNNGDLVTYQIPQSILKEGENLIAVEVHQNSVSSSDLIFDLQLTYQPIQIITLQVFIGTLSDNIALKAVYEKWDNPDADLIPPVVINEVVAANTVISDEFGGKDDYIELYNNGDTDINIGGWYLTDTPANRMLGQIPVTDPAKTTIPAKGRIVIWADDQAMQGVLHMGFKLGKEGETIILSKTNSQGLLVKIDSVAFPAMESNMSYSRVPDGSTTWLLQTPTINQTNLITSVESPVKNSVLVYPTLASETITIRNAAGNKLRITDLTGKVILTTECISETEIIQVGSLHKGVYIISVGNCTVKMIKL